MAIRITYSDYPTVKDAIEIDGYENRLMHLFIETDVDTVQRAKIKVDDTVGVDTLTTGFTKEELYDVMSLLKDVYNLMT